MSRDAVLARVKQAVAEGNRAGIVPPLPARSSVGYQGAGADPLARFCSELTNAGGKAHVAHNAAAVIEVVRSILQTHQARCLLLSAGGLVDRMGVSSELAASGFDVQTVANVKSGMSETFFQADVGITNAYRLIAETGTVVVAANPDEPRSVSLLPPVHIAIAERSQILPDLFDLFDLFSPTAPDSMTPPSCLTVITGPSKTGDIELRLVTGVHGPGEVHVIVLDNEA